MAKQAMGPSTLRGTKQAKGMLVVILETLAGTCTTGEAAERLSISLSRYYQLETRALQGMLTALEPRQRGPRKTKEAKIRALKAEIGALKRDLRRATSLLRAASRSVGVKAKPKRAASKKKGARRKRKARGTTVLETIRESTSQEGEDGTHEPGGAAAVADRSQ